MSEVVDKLTNLWPEISLAAGAVLCLCTGLLSSAAGRRLTPVVAVASLALSALLVSTVEPATDALLGPIASYVKVAIAVIGALLVLITAGVPERLLVSRKVAEGEEEFDPADAVSGEFYAFLLLSLTGAMLTAGAGDLVWLFLALELTSLPTYVLVATSRSDLRAQEAGVKYFFLGALAAATFLYGFALMFGATGTTSLMEIRDLALAGASPLLLTGVALALIGIAFKIAAVPMHFYAADVYEGADVSVTAFLAFVPKIAGIVAMAMVVATVGWNPLPEPIAALLWIMAALTMTVGNTLGLLQTNVKRILAYSSVAHSGYLLVGLIAGPEAYGEPLGNGLAAILFYIVAYAMATLAAFAVLGCLRRDDGEAEDLSDLAGLVHREPALAAVLLISMLSLIGLPPMVGFLGKVYLFGSAIEAGWTGLVIVAVINSAISAVYYLRIVGAAFFGEPAVAVTTSPSISRRIGAGVAAAAAIALGLAGGPLATAAHQATQVNASPVRVQTPATPEAEPTAEAEADARLDNKSLIKPLG